MNRDMWAAIAATIGVIVVAILGFGVLGSPGTQRLVQSDLRSVRTLGELAQQIKQTWNSSGKVLPGNLDGFPNSVKRDPVTNKIFTYRPKSNSEYELCSTFRTDNRNPHNQSGNEDWVHPKGDYCFQLDASQQVPEVPYND